MKDRQEIMKLKKYLDDAWLVGKQKDNWNSHIYWHNIWHSVQSQFEERKE